MFSLPQRAPDSKKVGTLTYDDVCWLSFFVWFGFGGQLCSNFFWFLLKELFRRAGMDMGFCIGGLLWSLLKFLSGLHVLWACQKY